MDTARFLSPQQYNAAKAILDRDVVTSTIPKVDEVFSTRHESTRPNCFRFYQNPADTEGNLPLRPKVVSAAPDSIKTFEVAPELRFPWQFIDQAKKACADHPRMRRLLLEVVASHDPESRDSAIDFISIRRRIDLFQELFCPSGQLDDWNERLNTLSTLPIGWDSYNAAPPSPTVIASSRVFLKTLGSRKFPPAKIAPSVVGGVVFTFRSENRAVYVEFRNTGNAHAAFDDPDMNDPEVLRVTQDLNGFDALITRAENFLNE